MGFRVKCLNHVLYPESPATAAAGQGIGGEGSYERLHKRLKPGQAFIPGRGVVNMQDGIGSGRISGTDATFSQK